MDNHLAAAWCWLQKLEETEHYNFFHVDQHEDLWNNAPLESYNIIKDNTAIALEEYLALEYGNNREKCFNYGNYIIQMKNIFPLWFEESIFACPTTINDSNFNIIENVSCYELHESIALLEQNPNKWILNIDIDYFFMSNYQIFTDEYIKRLCIEIRNNYENIAVCTIALSPECCGGWDNSIHIANVIFDELEIDLSLD